MRHYKWLITGAIILVLPILLAGCVAKSEYETLQEKYTNLQANYEVSQEELGNLQVDYNILLEGKVTLENEVAEMLAETESLQEQLEDLENTLNIYRYTYGRVFSEVQPPLSKTSYGDPVILLNREVAVDPTWEQLEFFLGEDKTDLDTYIVDYQMCGYFAEKLHNNAENAGIRCALVVLNLGSDLHTLNAFKTTDSGLVFIDSTGREIQAIPSGWSPPADPSWDKLVTLRMGQEVIFGNLFPERATFTSWPMYLPQKWELEWESIGTVYDIEVYW